jgi:raffinose/stachyose/melibiose transport system substrate-binding protein
MFKRKAGLSRVAAVLTIALVGSLAACSTSGPAVDANAEQTINWWSWNPNVADAQPYIDAFEAENPNITVVHRYIEYSDYVNTVRLAATTSTGPDVFGVQVGSLTEQFAPLAVDLAPYAEEAIGADWTDKLSASDQLTFEDKQVGMPWMVTGAGLVYYNKTLLDAAGLSAPTNLDEWKSVCEALDGTDTACFVHGAKDAWVGLDVFQAISNQIAPGEFYSAIAGDSQFDSETFVTAFTTWKSLFDDGIMQEGALGVAQYPDANDAFTSGKAAMIALGTWANSYMTTDGLAGMVETFGDPAIADFEFLPMPFPAVVPNATTGALFGGPDVGWAISDASEKKDAAWTFVQFLTASESGQTLMGKTLQQPALKSVPVDLSGITTEAQKAAMGELAIKLGDLIGARQIPNPDIETAIGNALSAVAAGTQTPEDAAKAVQAVIDSAG